MIMYDKNFHTYEVWLLWLSIWREQIFILSLQTSTRKIDNLGEQINILTLRNKVY